MSTLTITGSNNNYSVSPDPCPVTDGSLTVIVPSGGVLICLDKDLENKKSHVLLQNRTFDMTQYPNADKWTYMPYGPTDTCPSSSMAANASENVPHTIQIGNGK